MARAESPNRHGESAAGAEPAISDPFALAPDTAAYVPRGATEAALEELVRSVRDPVRSTVMIGPTGIGKTLLLRILAERLGGELNSVYLPFCALSPTEMSDWVLRLLGSPPADDPIAMLSAYGRHLESEGEALLVLVDGGEALPRATAERFGRLVNESRGALRWVVIGTAAAGWRHTLSAIGDRVDVVEFATPMTRAETRHYIDARLALARVPQSARDRFTDGVVDRLHRASGGIPGRLHARAADVLHGPGASQIGAAETRAAARRADVLGTDTRRPAAGPPDSATTYEFEPDRVLRELAPIERRDPEEPTAPKAPDEPEDEIEIGIRQLRELALRPPENRIAPPPSRRGVILGVLLIGAITLVAPLILVQLRRQTPSPGVEAVAAPIAAIPDAGPTPAVGSAELDLLPVNVNATPWAAIRIDGIDMGETPLASIPLLVGTHRFRAEMPDGRIVERDIAIDADNRFVVFP